MDYKEKQKLKKDALRKWNKFVNQVGDIIWEMMYPCGYCTIHDGVCEDCEMHRKGICYGSKDTISLFGKALTKGDNFLESLVDLRNAIHKDINNQGKEDDTYDEQY